MAHLAEQILVWLPISLIVRLGPEKSRKILAARRELIPLPPEKLLNQLASKMRLKDEDPQVWLPLLSGDLIQPLARRLDQRFLLKRALRLRDHQTCRQALAVALREPLPNTFWDVLLGGDPETVRLALTRRLDYTATIPDPAAIPWSPELVQVITAHLQSRNWLGRSKAQGYTALAGHLQLASLEVVAKSNVDWEVYAGAFIRSREIQLPGYQPKFTAAEIDLLRSRLPKKFTEGGVDAWFVSLGCQCLVGPESGSDMTGHLLFTAVHYCQPRVLQFLLSSGVPLIDDYYPPEFLTRGGAIEINPLQVAAAREMLQLLERRNLQPGKIYLTSLRIVCGLPVNMEIVRGDSVLEPLMVIVAHPQLEQGAANMYWNLDISRSCVHYDLPKLFYLLPQRPVDAKDMALVYAAGALVPILLQEGDRPFQQNADCLFPS